MQTDLGAYNWDAIDEAVAAILHFQQEVAQVPIPVRLEQPEEAGQVDPWPAKAGETVNRLIDAVRELAGATVVDVSLPDPLAPPEAEGDDAGAGEALRGITDKINELISRHEHIVGIPTPERPAQEAGLRELLEDILRELGRLGSVSATGARVDTGPLGIGVGVYEQEGAEGAGGVLNDLPMLFGEAKAAWVAGEDHVHLTPCLTHLDNTANGRPEVTGYLISPTGDTPGAKGLVYDIDQGDIMAYIPFGVDLGVIVNANLVLPAASEGDILVMAADGKWTKLTKGANHSVVQVSGAGAMEMGWVKAHG